MKTIGMIGGTSWVSTVDYYRYINQLTNERLGGNESAQMIIHSVNYGETIRLTMEGKLDQVLSILTDACKGLETAGADFIILGANTMHRFYPEVEAAVNIPVIHIARVTAEAIKRAGLTRIGLLGTKFTMELPFYTEILKEYGIETFIPEKDERDFLQRTISDELGKGIFTSATRERYIAIIRSLADKGAEGVILGCTEIPMLISAEESPLPSFDTTMLHSKAAVDFALEGITAAV